VLPTIGGLAIPAHVSGAAWLSCLGALASGPQPFLQWAQHRPNWAHPSTPPSRLTDWHTVSGFAPSERTKRERTRNYHAAGAAVKPLYEMIGSLPAGTDELAQLQKDKCRT